MNTTQLRIVARNLLFRDDDEAKIVNKAADEIDRLRAESQRYREAMLKAENMLQSSRFFGTASPGALDAQDVLQKALDEGGE